MARSLADDSPGARIYAQQCAACHGQQGEGVQQQYAHPLVGDRSLAELTRLIAETMPEEDPESCVGEEAAQVASFVFNSFYSAEAQARHAGPSRSLARLTVRQYQQSVADLVGSFSGLGTWDSQRGLNGTYFNARNFRNDKRALERRDPVVDFQFESGSPDEKIGKEEFAIRWEGGLLAPETGLYRFTIKTENGARLWVNNNSKALIDAWVRSGPETEHTATVHLLGGRPIPLRLEFFKSKQGKEETASISLMWKPPHQGTEVIPQRHLLPHRYPHVLAVATPFPPDDRSMGYERGIAISKEWDEATTYAAIETAGYVVANLPELSGVKSDASDRDRRLREFSYQFAQRAFRRPLNDEQKLFFVDRLFDSSATPDDAVKKVVLLTLKSPRFLYPELTTTDSVDDYGVAARLALTCWDSLPDTALTDAASAGQLKTPEQVAKQVRRMVAEPRTRGKMREFLHQWLTIDRLTDISKDPSAYPGFDEPLVADLRTSLDLFLEEIVWGESPDFRHLLLADYLYLNGRLGAFYGVPLPLDAGFEKHALSSHPRAGVLSHPFLLAGLAYHSTSSPIHRGVFVSRSLLGRTLRPPPEAVSPLSPDLHADLTTRERVNLQTSPESCQTCHAMINPLGFSLENFDAVGRYRTEERNRPIDSSAEYRTVAGDRVPVNGVRELAEYLAQSDESHGAFVAQLFHHFVKQSIRAFGPSQLADLKQRFAEHEFDIRELLVDVAVTSALTTP